MAKTSLKRKPTFAAGSTKKSRGAKPAPKQLAGPKSKPQLEMAKPDSRGLAIPAAATGAVALLQQGLPLPFADNGPHPSVPLAIGDVVPSPLNPRWRLPPDDEAKMIALAENIDARGQLQAIMVRPGRGDLEGKHEIAIGFRRYRAIKWLIDQKRRPAEFPIMAVVRDMSDAELVLAAGSENLSREDMHELDEADIYAATLAHIVPDKGRSKERLHAAVARIYGVGEATVHRRLALLKCSREVQDALYKGRISLGQAQALALGTETAQAAALARITAGADLSAADIKRTVTGDRVPVASAPFPREKYQGEIVTDPDTGIEYFADPVEFDQLAFAILEQKAQALRNKWRWVEVCEGDFDKIYANRDIDFKPIDPKDPEAGAVVCYERSDGAVEIVAPALKKTVIEKRKRDARRAIEDAERAKADRADEIRKTPARPDEACIAEAQDVLRLFHEAIRHGDAEGAQGHATRMDEIAREMNGGDDFAMATDNGGQVRLCRALTAPAGEMPLFGQPGTFEVRLPEGVRVRIETDGLFDVAGELGFEAHAVDPDAPFISEIGFLGFTIPRAEKKPGMTLADFVLAEIDRDLTAPVKKNGLPRKRQLVAIEDKYRQRIAAEAGATPVAAAAPPITSAELRQANEEAETHGQTIDDAALADGMGGIGRAVTEPQRASADPLEDQLLGLLDGHLVSLPFSNEAYWLIDRDRKPVAQFFAPAGDGNVKLAALIAAAMNELASRAGLRLPPAINDSAKGKATAKAETASIAGDELSEILREGDAALGSAEAPIGETGERAAAE